jgi:hypothetical protein
MASTLALGPVHAAALDRLKTTAALTTIVPAVRVTDSPTTATITPYVLVEGADETPFNTMGEPTAAKWGGLVGLRVRVVSTYRGDKEVYDLMTLVKAALDGLPLTVAGYPTAIVVFQRADLLKDTINNIVTRELVGTFSVTAHQSS